MPSLDHSLLRVFVLLIFTQSTRVHSAGSVRDLDGRVRERVAAARRTLTPLADEALDQLAALYLPVDAADEQCRQHSALTLDSFRRAEHWAADMVEASTLRLSHGVSVEPGRHRQCLSAREPRHLFSGQLCMVETTGVYPPELTPYLDWGVTPNEWTALLTGPIKGLMFAVCVPSSCSPDDVNRRINASLAAINASSAIHEEGCTSARGRPLDRLDWAALLIFSGLGLLIAFSTWRDKQYKNAEHKSKVLDVFALQGNWARLASTSRPSASELACLDGLRTLSIVIVIASHRSLFSFAFSRMHYADVVEYIEGYGAAILEIMTRSIEVFLVIGGVLRAYTFLQSRRKGKPLNTAQSILLRYFRYTPSLAAVVLFTASLLRHSSSGPMWDWECKTLSAPCQYFWFLPLLHLGNYLFPLGCVGTSWYLAADFHMFIISFLVLIPLHRRPRLGFVILTLGFLLSFGIYFYTTYNNGTFGGQIAVDGVRKIEVDVKSYFDTHIRVSTYFLGLSLGYVVLSIKAKKVNTVLTKGQVRFGWVVCALILAGHFWAALLVLRADRPLSLLDPLYTTLTKLAGAIITCWLILICAIDHGGILNRFLSWPGFMPLSKLTVGIILVNQQVVTLHMTRQQGPFLFDYIDSTFLMFGDLCICSIIAVVLYLTVESPCYRLAEHFLSSATSPASKLSINPDINTKQTQSDANERRSNAVSQKAKKLQ